MISDSTLAESASLSAAVSALKEPLHSNNAALAAIIAIGLGLLAPHFIHLCFSFSNDVLEDERPILSSDGGKLGMYRSTGNCCWATGARGTRRLKVWIGIMQPMSQTSELSQRPRKRRDSGTE